VKISGSPIDALMPGAMLFVGTDRQQSDNSLRVYLNARYEGIHVHVEPGESADKIEQVWGARHLGHLFATEIDTAGLCKCEAAS
jgi:hypothetical protein